MKYDENKERDLSKAAIGVAKAVLEHRLSKYTLDSTNVKGKL